MLKDYLGRSVQTGVALVNTFDPVTGEDALDTISQSAHLLRELQWEGTDSLTPLDHAWLRRWRHELRAIFDTEDETQAVDILNGFLDAAASKPRMTNHDGEWHWHYSRVGAPLRDRVTTATAVALLSAIADGALPRMRTCEGVDCSRVFVDTSRPGTRLYCEPAGCANRAHVRAFRSRVRTQASRGN
ncbi:CGNR zinc finger domain-containing protein [Microbacterium sp. RD1]|uniref:CGNR zinc finger domain-containing protein n=1 Tax=Microbacterium sp. RD1 TaxID=3457313 RepID=UPI003FA56D9A